MADTPRTAAQRQREHRQRQRDGKIMLTVAVDEAHLSAVLVDSRRLPITVSDDRERIRQALEAMLRDLKAIDLVE